MEISAAHFARALSPQEELKIARSDFIDAFNTADLAVRHKLERLKGVPNHLLGHNIETLVKVPAAPQYSKRERARVIELLSELRELNSIRCDVVHSAMQTHSIDGLEHGFFSNVQSVTGHGRTGTLLPLTLLHGYTEDLMRIARELEA